MPDLPVGEAKGRQAGGDMHLVATVVARLL